MNVSPDEFQPEMQQVKYLYQIQDAKFALGRVDHKDKVKRRIISVDDL